MAMDVEAEIRDLKRRVSELEGSFGFLTDQVRGVHKDLLAFEARTEQRFEAVDERFDKVDARLDRVDERFDKVDERFDKVDERFDEVGGRLARVEVGLKALRDELPGVVGDAMRAVMREGSGKPRK
jgi:predicted nuclease with TOPRIM domain